MNLASEFRPPSSDSNKGILLVSLHGLWGDKQEFSPIADALNHWPWLGIDLPGHGQSQAVQVQSLAHVCHMIGQVLASYASFRPVLLGYSLGARIAQYGLAMKLWPNNLVGVIAEGGHLGLTDALERQQRALQDSQWAERFCHQPVAQVLEAWYQQPVFATLSDLQRRALIVRRQHNHGPAVAKMLLATSLATQPNLRPYLRAQKNQLNLVCGAEDKKFLQLYQDSQWRCFALAGAGHNAHCDNPAGFAALVKHIIDHWVNCSDQAYQSF